MKKGNTFHLYIKSKMTQDRIPERQVSDRCWASKAKFSGMSVVSSKNYTLREEDDKIKNILEKYADKYNLELIIHDLRSKEEMKKARLNGIKSTPVIVTNKGKISHVPSDEESLLKLLGVPEEERRELMSRYEGDFVCQNCGSHSLKVYPDGSGYCPDCKKTYQTVK